MKRPLRLLGLLLALLPPALPGQAQKRPDGTYIARIGLNLLGGWGYHSSYRSDSYGRFTSNFNNFYRSRLRSELALPAFTSNWFYGGDLHAGPAYIAIVQHRMLSSVAAEYRNGDRREIMVDLRPIDLNCDLMFPAGQRLEIGMALGWQQQKGTIRSGYRYANGGPLSYAEDQGLNGIYSLRGANTINVGLRLDLKLAKLEEKSLVTLSARAEYIGLMQSYLAGNSALLPWPDWMMKQASNGAINIDGYQSLYLSEDPREQFNPSVRFVGQGSSLNGAFTGWRFGATLIITPFEIIPD